MNGRPKFSEVAQDRNFSHGTTPLRENGGGKTRPSPLSTLLATLVVLLSLWTIYTNWDNQRNDPYQTIPEGEVQGR